MSFHYLPKIVTDGLVLCLDASDQKSYNGSGVVWNDRSVNKKNATFSGITYDNQKFIFNGLSTARCVSSLLAADIGNICTVNMTCTIANFGNFNSGAGRLVSLDRSSGSTKWCLATKSTGGIQFCGNGGNDSPFTFDVELNELFTVTLVLNNTNYKLYKNGILQLDKTSNPSSASFGNVSIGCRPNTTDRSLNGSIYNCTIYNRTLSEAEILQNFNAMKSRFKL